MLKKLLLILFSFTFVLTISSALIVRFNIIGLDDKNLILFFTSPPFWVLEQYGVQIEVIYISTIVFWFIAGILLDLTLTKKIYRFLQENF
jgi:hypothetical protein